jgi:hypothetical protein
MAAQDALTVPGGLLALRWPAVRWRIAPRGRACAACSGYLTGSCVWRQAATLRAAQVTRLAASVAIRWVAWAAGLPSAWTVTA